MQNIVLINPFPVGQGLNDATVEPPLGLCYIAAVLEKNNYVCSIIDANVERLSNRDIINRIKESPSVIGIYLNSFLFSVSKDLCAEIRKKFPDSLILLGGPLASTIPEVLLDEFLCDGIIKGEGEYAVLGIMNNISAGKPAFDETISGAVYKLKDGNIRYNDLKRIVDLDELPFPALHLLPKLKAYKSRSRKKPIAPIITSRGCPYGCSFCSKDIFGRKITMRSANNVLDEIDFLVTKYGVKQIDILDDNFAQNRQRLIDILDGIIVRNYNLAINLQSGVRIENIDEEILVKMKQAGVYKIAFGVETADEKLLEIHNKKLNLKKMEEVVSLSKRLGFLTYGFFIIGLLGETDKEFDQTMRFAKKIDFDVANFCMAIPFVGTDLFRMVEAEGKFLIDTRKNIDSGFYDGRVFYEYGNQKGEDILARYNRAYKEFYSIGKKIKVFLAIRSFSELAWLIDAVWFVIKGMIKKRQAKVKPDIRSRD